MLKRVTMSVLVVLATLALGAWSCQVPNQPNQGSPEPAVTTPLPHPTYTHQPIGKAVPPVNPPAGWLGNVFVVQMAVRLYDQNGLPAIGFDAPYIKFRLEVWTASGEPAEVTNLSTGKIDVAPIEFSQHPPFTDEQGFQELTTYPDGSVHGILSALWTLTATLNPGWKIECTITNMSGMETVSHRSFKNTTPTTVKGTVGCLWPYDIQSS